jgi:hypothetical protein
MFKFAPKPALATNTTVDEFDETTELAEKFPIEAATIELPAPSNCVPNTVTRVPTRPDVGLIETMTLAARYVNAE